MKIACDTTFYLKQSEDLERYQKEVKLKKKKTTLLDYSTLVPISIFTVTAKECPWRSQLHPHPKPSGWS